MASTSSERKTAIRNEGGFFVKNPKHGRKEFRADGEKNDQKLPAMEKKHFDKKAWRLQKYSKKYKLQQWEERRKKKLLRSYRANFKIAEKGSDEEDSTKRDEKSYRKPHEEFHRVVEERSRRKEEILKSKSEADSNKRARRRIKAQKQKIFNKKTRRGQPIMKGRLELLLEQIQKSVATNG